MRRFRSGFEGFFNSLKEDLDNFSEIVFIKAKLIMNRFNKVIFFECIPHIVFSLGANGESLSSDPWFTRL